MALRRSRWLVAAAPFVALLAACASSAPPRAAGAFASARRASAAAPWVPAPTVAGTLLEPRALRTLTLLPSGDVLVVGTPELDSLASGYEVFDLARGKSDDGTALPGSVPQKTFPPSVMGSGLVVLPRAASPEDDAPSFLLALDLRDRSTSRLPDLPEACGPVRAVIAAPSDDAVWVACGPSLWELALRGTWTRRLRLAEGEAIGRVVPVGEGRAFVVTARHRVLAFADGATKDVTGEGWSPLPSWNAAGLTADGRLLYLTAGVDGTRGLVCALDGCVPGPSSPTVTVASDWIVRDARGLFRSANTVIDPGAGTVTPLPATGESWADAAVLLPNGALLFAPSGKDVLAVEATAVVAPRFVGGTTYGAMTIFTEDGRLWQLWGAEPGRPASAALFDVTSGVSREAPVPTLEWPLKAAAPAEVGGKGVFFGVDRTSGRPRVSILSSRGEGPERFVPVAEQVDARLTPLDDHRVVVTGSQGTAPLEIIDVRTATSVDGATLPVDSDAPVAVTRGGDLLVANVPRADGALGLVRVKGPAFATTEDVATQRERLQNLTALPDSDDVLATSYTALYRLRERSLSPIETGVALSFVPPLPLANGRAFVVLGDAGVYTGAVVVDVGAATVTPLLRLRSPAISGTAHLDGERITLVCTSPEVVDLATKTSAPAASPLASRSAVSVVGSERGALFFGGEAAAGPTSTVELLATPSLTVQRVGALSTPRTRASFTRIGRARLVVAGGLGEGGDLPSFEIWDEDRGAPVQGGAMAPRRDHGALRLPSGAVLLVGGSRGDAVLADTEVIDPATGRASPGPALLRARRRPCVTLLPTGEVLVVGGYSTTAAEGWVAEAERLDVARGLSRSEGTVPYALGACSALAELDGTVSLYGNDVLRYDPSSRAYARGEVRGIGGTDPAAARLGNGTTVASGDEPWLAPFGPRLPALWGTAAAVSTADGVVLTSSDDGLKFAPPGAIYLSERPASGLGAAPAVTAAPPEVRAREPFVLRGSGFRAVAGVGATGTTFDPSAVPVVEWTSAAGARVRGAVSRFTDGSVEVTLPATVHHGPGWLRVIVDAVSSRGVFLELLPSSLGRACAADAECVAADGAAGHCADGVCCDGACTFSCQACTRALKGGGEDGTCGPVVAGTDPKRSCEAQDPSTCGLTGTCDGAGKCAVVADDAPCRGGFCHGGACRPARRSCAPDGSAVIAEGVAPESCGAYRCRDGVCLHGCQSGVDCGEGLSCFSDGRCLPTPAAAATRAPTCSAHRPRAGGAGAGAPTLAFVVLGWVVAFARRRR